LFLNSWSYGPFWPISISAAIANALHLSESSVEKYINAIFSKLGLSEERSVSRRVSAVLAYLQDANGSSRMISPGESERR
jgi:hypothetical protein